MLCQVTPDTLCFGRYAPAPQGTYSPAAMTPARAKEALEVCGLLLWASTASFQTRLHSRRGVGRTAISQLFSKQRLKLHPTLP